MNNYENISNTLSIDCTVGNNQFLTSPSSPSPISTSTSTTNASSFVKKLFDMVENESDDIIVWVANGTAFEVKDPKRLENEILPNFFRHCRFQSLVRQLNFYAFKKISKERSSWVYSHDHFKKNRPDLLEKLRRKTNGVAAMNKRNAEVLNGMTNTLRKKRKITNENASYTMMNTGMNSSYKGGELSGDESSDEFADDDVLLLDNDESILSNNSPTNVKRNVWSLEKHESQSDEIDTYSVMCKCWDDVHQYFGLHKNCPLSSHHDHETTEEEEEDLSPSDTDSTLLKLFSFCSQRNPWIESHGLFADIYQLLTADSLMANEINDYFVALSPPSTKNDNVQILKTNEITIVRTFITYALARLHELESESSYFTTPVQLLSQSIDKWSSYARMCT